MICTNCQRKITQLPCIHCNYKGSHYDRLGDEDGCGDAGKLPEAMAEHGMSDNPDYRPM